MTRRLTITIEDDLEHAIEEAAELLDIPEGASDSEKFRAYARLGYEVSLDESRERERLATYHRWANAPEMIEMAEATFRSALNHGVFEDL